MTAIRLIPGHVSNSGLKALLIAPAGRTTPTVTLTGTGAPDRVRATALDRSDAFAAAMADHDAALYLVDVAGLRANTAYTLTAKRGRNSHTVTLRTLPNKLPKKGMTVYVGSCYFQTGALNRAPDLIDSLEENESGFAPPLFRMMVGNNLYFDLPLMDPTQGRGYPDAVGRYLSYFRSGDYADFLSMLPTVTTWDDHEFWNNFPESQFQVKYSKPPFVKDYTAAARECLQLFQASLNPAPVSADGKSLSCAFDACGISFFLADTRSNRTKMQRATPRIMTAADMKELRAWAAGLETPGVLVLGQPLWLAKGTAQTDFTPANYEGDFGEIWQALETAPFDILVVSGDVHYNRLIQYGSDQRTVTEFVSSPASLIRPNVGKLPNLLNPIKAPGSLKAKCPDGPARDLKFKRYIMGSHAKSAFGLLNFQSHATKLSTVTVAAAFMHSGSGPGHCIDLKTGRLERQRTPPGRRDCILEDRRRIVLGPR